MTQEAYEEGVHHRDSKKVSLTSYDLEFKDTVATPFKPLWEKDAMLNSADAKILFEKDTKELDDEQEDIIVVNVHALVVDDNLLDRKIVERLVKNASFKVTAVEGGAKALEVLASPNNNINLIVTDYCMPEMSGYDLLKHVKETPSLEGIPVVIMSSENVLSRIQSCLDHGAEEFILKPLKVTDVKRFKSYVCGSQTNLLDHQSAACKKRKVSGEGFRGPRIGRVTVA